VIRSYLGGEGKRSLKEVLVEETNEDKLMMQLMMEQYFRTFDKIKDWLVDLLIGLSIEWMRIYKQFIISVIENLYLWVK
jgi:hypothetical protein